MSVILECKYGKGRYPKVVLSSSPSAFLKFLGGRSVVSDEDFKVVQAQPQYGREFAKLGGLKGAIASIGPVAPKVTRGAGSVKKPKGG